MSLGRDRSTGFPTHARTHHSYEENANRLIGAMKERHAAELKAFQQRLISKTTTPKFSKELLNLRKIQDVLAKKKECVRCVLRSPLSHLSLTALVCTAILRLRRSSKKQMS